MVTCAGISRTSWFEGASRFGVCAHEIGEVDEAERCAQFLTGLIRRAFRRTNDFAGAIFCGGSLWQDG